MNTVILAAVAAARVACPVHMLWQTRRGRAKTCRPAPSHEHDIATVRQGQRDLEAHIAELSTQNGAHDQSYVPATRG
jgi:hypothetical protein